MTKIEKPLIGIYRTVYPLYSETFISEQIRCLSECLPVVITRNAESEIINHPVIGLTDNSRSLESLLFTAFGALGRYRADPKISKIRLLHAHFAPDSVLALSIAQHFKIPLITTCHGSDVTTSDWNIIKDMKISGYRYLLQRRRLFKYGAKFIAVSDFLKQKMIDVGYPAEKVLRHYVGIDTARFLPWRQERMLLDGIPYILSVARHTDVKGIDLLLKAFALVSRSNPSLRLVQIGSGKLTQKLINLARDLKIADKVTFTGALPSSEVLRYVQQSKVFVLSSRKSVTGAEEAFGLVLTEAAACEIPCIGTKVGGIPEAILHGETGFLTAPEDVTDMAEKIKLLLSNADLASSMGKRGREFACDSFDLKKQTRMLEKIYAEHMP